jgi:WD40 repeat protein
MNVRSGHKARWSWHKRPCSSRGRTRSGIQSRRTIYLNGSYDKVVRIWFVADGSLVDTLFGNTNTVWQLTYSPNGAKLASGGVDKVLLVWDVTQQHGKSGKMQALTGHEGDIWTIAFSPDGKTMASSGEDAVIKIWDVATGQLINALRAHDWAVLTLAFSLDGKTLASGGGNKIVRLWQTSNWQLLDTLDGDSQSVYALVFSPDSKTLISVGRDKNALGEVLQYHVKDSSGTKSDDNGVTIRIWDVQSRQFLQALSRHSKGVRSLALSHDGKWLVSASEDKNFIIWSMVH